MFGSALAADFVKVPHHGSPNRSSAFPGYVTPDYAVFSYGLGNPYGHPNPDVVDEWEAVGAAIYETALDGDITVLAKNGALDVYTQH